jgi:RimJ/RimL family protein N-acetyltransferase
LRLRPPRLDDAEPIFAEYAQDAEVTRYLLWEPQASCESVRGHLSQMLALTDGSRIAWIITVPPPDAPVGMIDLRRERRTAEAGFVLRRADWGRGYVTEALAAVLEFAFDELGLVSVTADCHIDNVASWRVLEKAGMRRASIRHRHAVFPTLGPDPCDVYHYVRSAPERV